MFIFCHVCSISPLFIRVEFRPPSLYKGIKPAGDINFAKSKFDKSKVVKISRLKKG